MPKISMYPTPQDLVDSKSTFQEWVARLQWLPKACAYAVYDIVLGDGVLIVNFAPASAAVRSSFPGIDCWGDRYTLWSCHVREIRSITFTGDTLRIDAGAEHHGLELTSPSR